MASPGARFAWGATKVVVGLVVFALAVLFVHVCGHALVPLPFAVVFDVLLLIVLPIALTRLLLPALRRIDAQTRFIHTLPGLTVIWCVLLLVAVSWAGRGWVSRTLANAPRAERDLPPWITKGLARVGGWLTPRAPASILPRPTPRPVPPHADAGVRRDAAVAIDASVPRDSGHVALRPDATIRDVTVAIAPASVDAAVSPPPRETPAVDVTVCPHIRSLIAIDLGQGSPDELVVGCDDSVQVFWLQQAPVIFLRTLFRYDVPSALQLVARDPMVADLDEDGRRDVALCAFYTSNGGGTRGGKSWWGHARPDGQFVTPVGLDDGECAALASGDVTGDGHAELFVAREGNVWDTVHPEGTLVWYARAHNRWQLRGNFRLAPDPQRMWVVDANDDEIGDLFVSDEHATTWFQGSAHGLVQTDAGVPSVLPPPRIATTGDFDGDGHPDRIETDDSHVRIFMTTPRETPVRSVSRSLDFAEYLLVGR